MTNKADKWVREYVHKSYPSKKLLFMGNGVNLSLRNIDDVISFLL